MARESTKDFTIFRDYSPRNTMELAVRFPTREEVEFAGCENFFYANLYVQQHSGKQFALIRALVEIDPEIIAYHDRFVSNEEKDDFLDSLKKEPSDEDKKRLDEWRHKNRTEEDTRHEKGHYTAGQRVYARFELERPYQIEKCKMAGGVTYSHRTVRQNFARRRHISPDKSKTKIQVRRAGSRHSISRVKGLDRISEIMSDPVGIYFALREAKHKEYELQANDKHAAVNPDFHLVEVNLDQREKIPQLGRKHIDPEERLWSGGKQPAGSRRPARLAAVDFNPLHPQHPESARNIRFERPDLCYTSEHTLDDEERAIIQDGEVEETESRAMRHAMHKALADRFGKIDDKELPKQRRNIIIRHNFGDEISGFEIYTLPREPKQHMLNYNKAPEIYRNKSMSRIYIDFDQDHPDGGHIRGYYYLVESGQSEEHNRKTYPKYDVIPDHVMCDINHKKYMGANLRQIGESLIKEHIPETVRAWNKGRKKGMLKSPYDKKTQQQETLPGDALGETGAAGRRRRKPIDRWTEHVLDNPRTGQSPTPGKNS